MEDSCHLAKESHFAGEHHYQREVMMLLLVLVFGSLINRRVAQEGFIHLFSSFIITFRLSINHRPIEMNVILRLTAGQSLRPISSGRLGLKEIRDVKDYRRMDSCFKKKKEWRVTICSVSDSLLHVEISLFFGNILSFIFWIISSIPCNLEWITSRWFHWQARQESHFAKGLMAKRWEYLIFHLLDYLFYSL